MGMLQIIASIALGVVSLAAAGIIHINSKYIIPDWEGERGKESADFAVSVNGFMVVVFGLCLFGLGWLWGAT